LIFELAMDEKKRLYNVWF